MQFSINCPSCSRSVPVDDRGRLPPWCSGCGATLSRDLVSSVAPMVPSSPTKPIPGIPAPAAVASPTPSSVSATVPIPKSTPSATGGVPAGPISFQACVPRFFQHERLSLIRFYVLEDELLAFRAGFGSIREGQFVPQNRVSRVLGGIGHGAKMLNVGIINCELGHLQDAEAVATLEGANAEALSLAARTMSGAVAIPARSLLNVRIEAPGMWFSFTRTIKCPALLKLGYGNIGTLALPSLTDARRAVEGLRTLLGNTIQINLPWGAKNS